MDAGPWLDEARRQGTRGVRDEGKEEWMSERRAACHVVGGPSFCGREPWSGGAAGQVLSYCMPSN